jgi:sugar transferase (PEP-CTERM/EpsH1 system associated)
MDDILFLAHRIPYPPNRGDKIRSWNILKRLGTLARVHLACFADDAADAAHLEGLRAAMGGSLGEAHVEARSASRIAAMASAIGSGAPVSLPLFASRSMQRFVDQVLRTKNIGTVFAFSGQMAQFVPHGLEQRFVMDFVDIDSAKFAAYAGTHIGPLSWVHAREAAKLSAFERATAARADLSLFVSQAEADLFRARAGLPDADIRALHNGVDLDYYSPKADFPRLPAPNGPLIVFTGQMDYGPNIAAVSDFARHALPLIRLVRPDAAFAIVGRNPAPQVLRLGKRPGVTVTGPVEDVRGWLAAADVVVAPLLIARGIQNKVLEAMAMGRSVVASPGAFEGIEAEPGRDLLVSPTGAAMAAPVLELLDHPARAAAMGAAARKCIEEVYPWEVKLMPLREMVASFPRKAAA